MNSSEDVMSDIISLQRSAFIETLKNVTLDITEI